MHSNGGNFDALVATIKEMQRTDPTAKDQWGAYCDQKGAGVRDPAKHEASILQAFINSYNSGVRLESAEKATLAAFFKEGQRKSANFKQCWASYCQVYGQGKHDPAKHEASFLIGFLDYLGTQGSIAMQLGTGGYFKGTGKGTMLLGSSDPMKDQLVQKVKSYQRSGPDQKQAWWDYCDNSLGGVRDPSKHAAGTLKQFLQSHAVT